MFLEFWKEVDSLKNEPDLQKYLFYALNKVSNMNNNSKFSNLFSILSKQMILPTSEISSTAITVYDEFNNPVVSFPLVRPNISTIKEKEIYNKELITANYLLYDGMTSIRYGLPKSVIETLTMYGFFNEAFTSFLDSRVLPLIDYTTQEDPVSFSSFIPNDTIHCIDSFFVSENPNSWIINVPIEDNEVFYVILQRIQYLIERHSEQNFFLFFPSTLSVGLQDNPISNYIKVTKNISVNLVSIDGMKLKPRKEFTYAIFSNQDVGNEIMIDIEQSFSKERYLEVYNTPTPVYIDEVKTKDGRTFFMINDAMKYECGSKERAIRYLCEEIRNRGNPIYVGPQNGYAQMVIAKAAYLSGRQAKLFIQSATDEYSQMTMRAIQYKPEVFIVKDTLKEAYTKATEYHNNHNGDSFIVSFGLNSQNYIEELSSSFLKEFNVTGEIQQFIQRLWITSGSGTLYKSLKEILPNTEFCLIQVGKELDSNILDKIFVSEIKFYSPTTILPPYPSIDTYDAKLWEFILKEGINGDFLINVGLQNNNVHNYLRGGRYIEGTQLNHVPNVRKIFKQKNFSNTSNRTSTSQGNRSVMNVSDKASSSIDKKGSFTNRSSDYKGNTTSIGKSFRGGKGVNEYSSNSDRGRGSYRGQSTGERGSFRGGRGRGTGERGSFRGSYRGTGERGSYRGSFRGDRGRIQFQQVPKKEQKQIFDPNIIYGSNIKQFSVFIDQDGNIVVTEDINDVMKEGMLWEVFDLNKSFSVQFSEIDNPDFVDFEDMFNRVFQKVPKESIQLFGSYFSSQNNNEETIVKQKDSKTIEIINSVGTKDLVFTEDVILDLSESILDDIIINGITKPTQVQIRLMDLSTKEISVQEYSLE